MKTPVFSELSENQSWIQKQCERCDDIILRPMNLGRDRQITCLIVYIETAVSNMMLEDSVTGKLLNHLWEMDQKEIRQAVVQNGLGISDAKEFICLEEDMGAMLDGNAIFFLDGYDKAWKIGSERWDFPGTAAEHGDQTGVYKTGGTEAVQSHGWRDKGAGDGFGGWTHKDTGQWNCEGK